LGISGSNIFAGTYGGVFLSTDNGASWTAANSGIPGGASVNAFAFSGSNIFAGTGSNGVFLSTDNGESWTEVNTGLTNTSFRAMAVADDNIFAGSYGGGVFHSTNNGESWTEINEGLTNTSVASFAFAGPYIFTGTDSGSAWKRLLSEIITATPSHDMPDKLSLFQNSPNPFSSTTTIRFKTDKTDFVKLTIYDMQGQEIETLVNEQVQAGSHEVIWNARAYTGGNYYYKLFVGKTVETKKMILVK
ncbi:MAG: T9SS type A sorting domain-containing protein, partial [Bacteroidales bacterium]|nr:T9SS type A sorting domain-containing protein [Bacteroidales bacterium]